ncbi:MAG: PDZ domain-containing protein, partial [Candidatus Binataceae bacterium]
ADLRVPREEARQIRLPARSAARRGTVGVLTLGVVAAALTVLATKFARQADTAPVSPSPATTRGALAPASAIESSAADSIFFLIIQEPAARQVAILPGEIEARVRTALERRGFHGIGVSASRSGDLYVAGQVYSEAEVGAVKRIASRVRGVRRAHFLHPDMHSADGLVYLGARTASSRSVWGATVVALTVGSPAERAGILPGDIIKQFDGATVADASELERALANHSPGDRVTVGLRRDGHELFVIVRLEAVRQLARN